MRGSRAEPPERATGLRQVHDVGDQPRGADPDPAQADRARGLGGRVGGDHRSRGDARVGEGRALLRARLHGGQRRLGARPAVRRHAVGARQEPGHVLPARAEGGRARRPAEPEAATRVNGETMQDSNTSQMIFGVAELISFCSHSFTLEPGDVILTGTPWGVGEFMDPKRSLKDGDVVECEIEGIGVLRNPVVEV